MSPSITRAMWARRWIGLAVAWGCGALLVLASVGKSVSTSTLLLGLPGALLAGVLACWAWCVMFPTVDDAASLRTLTGRPVLGGISQVQGAEQSAGAGKSDARFALLLVALVLGYGAYLAAVVVARPA